MQRWNIVGRLGARLGLLLAVGVIFATMDMPFSAARLESPGPQSPSASAARPLVVLNPSAVSPGQSFAVEGLGFPAGQSLQVSVTFSNGATLPIGQFQADAGGRVGGITVEIPFSLASGSFMVTVEGGAGSEKADANGYVVARIPAVSLSAGVGKAGDLVSFTANGFAPRESVSAFLNNIVDVPFATFTADEWGSLAEAPAVMPYAPTGENTLILVGEQSKAIATTSFITIGFFPTVVLSNYAPRGDEVVGFSGSAFGPNEQVRVHLNNIASPPVKTVITDGSGAFDEPSGFDVPFGMKGKQTFVFVGEGSGAVVAADLEIAPYSPSVEPSTWSGRPGTSVTFYGNGFARNELVRIFRAATQLKPAEEVSCFRTNGSGEVGGLGSYIIQPTDEVGQLDIELTTEKSQVSLRLSIQILPAIGDLPPGAVPPNRGCDQLRE